MAHAEPEKRFPEQVEEILGPVGRLAKAWPDYEPRPGQLTMARQVVWAFENQDAALVEAGTGTGKTLAYLIPALLSKVKTVVSTGTKNLQEQIYDKDIPFIRKFLGGGFTAACLKGRENYLCRHYFDLFMREPTFEAAGEAVFLETLKKWAGTTTTGDRAELTDLPEDFLIWPDITAPADRCLGRKCPEYKDCFLWRARRAAAAADLVVVNHHLFMADLAIREEGQGEAIPAYEAVIFDEAHQLEDVATQHFGVEVSSWRLARLKRDTERALVRAGKMNPNLGRSLSALGHHADGLSRKFYRAEGEHELTEGEELTALQDYGMKTAVLIEGLAAGLQILGDQDEELMGLSNRAKRISLELSFIIEAREAKYVFWAERRGRGLFLRASPVDVAPFLRERLFESGLPLVFTSATLTTQGSFKFLKERLGLLPETPGTVVESPFDYKRQTRLYVPRTLPHPQAPEYLPLLAVEVRRLLEISQGRAFVLFTSYRNLNYVAESLADGLPWPLLVQGQAPRSALLTRFRRETASVLLATQSFWQGVDVPGESLSAVIIDKLPFPRPDSPLVKARSVKLKDEGQDPFFNYLVPEAIINLKQGLGRLIRTKTDRGLLAVLDSRLITKGYGRMFLKSLPPMSMIHDPAEVGFLFEA